MKANNPGHEDASVFWMAGAGREVQRGRKDSSQFVVLSSQFVGSFGDTPAFCEALKPIELRQRFGDIDEAEHACVKLAFLGNPDAFWPERRGLNFKYGADFVLANNPPRRPIGPSWVYGDDGIGIAVPVIGTVAAIGLTVFFVGAIITHLRARDYSFGVAAVFLLLVETSLVLTLCARGSEAWMLMPHHHHLVSRSK